MFKEVKRKMDDSARPSWKGRRFIRPDTGTKLKFLFGIVNGKDGMLSQLSTELPDNWTKFVDEPMTDNELEKLRRSVNRQTPYGEECWQIKIGNLFGLASTLNPRGRPKKVGHKK
jgi:hypothetical protein